MLAHAGITRVNILIFILSLSLSLSLSLFLVGHQKRSGTVLAPPAGILPLQLLTAHLKMLLLKMLLLTLPLARVAKPARGCVSS
jgi:hypothetical protein